MGWARGVAGAWDERGACGVGLWPSALGPHPARHSATRYGGCYAHPPVLRTAYYVRNRPLFPVTGRHSGPVWASAQQYIRNKPSFRTAQAPAMRGAGREYHDSKLSTPLPHAASCRMIFRHLPINGVLLGIAPRATLGHEDRAKLKEPPCVINASLAGNV